MAWSHLGLTWKCWTNGWSGRHARLSWKRASIRPILPNMPKHGVGWPNPLEGNPGLSVWGRRCGGTASGGKGWCAWKRRLGHPPSPSTVKRGTGRPRACAPRACGWRLRPPKKACIALATTSWWKPASSRTLWTCWGCGCLAREEAICRSTTTRIARWTCPNSAWFGAGWAMGRLTQETKCVGMHAPTSAGTGRPRTAGVTRRPTGGTRRSGICGWTLRLNCP